MGNTFSGSNNIDQALVDAVKTHAGQLQSFFANVSLHDIADRLQPIVGMAEGTIIDALEALQVVINDINNPNILNIFGDLTKDKPQIANVIKNILPMILSLASLIASGAIDILKNVRADAIDNVAGGDEATPAEIIINKMDLINAVGADVFNALANVWLNIRGNTENVAKLVDGLKAMLPQVNSKQLVAIVDEIINILDTVLSTARDVVPVVAGTFITAVTAGAGAPAAAIIMPLLTLSLNIVYWANRAAVSTVRRGISAYTGGADGYKQYSLHKVGGASGKRFYGAEDFKDMSNVADYMNSANSEVKKKLMDDIIESLKTLGFKVNAGSLKESAAGILDQIPTGDKLKTATSAQTDACRKIGEVINKRFGNAIIDVKSGPEIVCQQVAEVVHSMSESMHTEFLFVHDQVKRIIKNLLFAKSILNETFEKLMVKIKTSDDPDLKLDTTMLSDVHAMVLNELERQVINLQNLVNVTLNPVEADLKHLIEKKKNIKGYIEKLESKPGSSGFSHVIADVLKGLGVTAGFAALIDRALNKVGITMADYAGSDSLQKLIEKINDTLVSKKLDDKDLHEYIQAAELLYKNFYRSKDIAEVYKNSQKVGSEDMSFYNDAKFGSDEPEEWGKSKYEKLRDDREKLRKLIFNSFNKQLMAVYHAMMVSMEAIAKKIGTEIPLSDQLDGFRHVLGKIKLSLITSKDIHYALTEYFNDALSKSKKEELIGEIKMVMSYLESLMEMAIYKNATQYFRDLHTSMKVILDLIEKYTQEVTDKLGTAYRVGSADDDDSEDKFGSTCEFLETAKKDGGNNYSGGIDQPEDYLGFKNDPIPVLRSPLNLVESIKKFDVNYKMAQIRMNLARASKDVDESSEKYTEMVAKSVADRISKLKQEMIDKMDYLAQWDPKKKEGKMGPMSADNYKKEHEAAVNWVKDEFDARKRFWNTLEAIDAYMRVFTNGLIKNPQDVKDIKTMLDSVETIAEWYNDATGEHLAATFDHFPSQVVGTGENIVKVDNTTNPTTADSAFVPHEDMLKTGDHYYAKIGARYAASTNKAASLPGNPYIVVDPVRGTAARDRLKKALSQLTILKNILSIFINIGSKFGNDELHRKTFMTPTQIYNNLVEFLQYSAFNQGFIIEQKEGDLSIAETRVRLGIDGQTISSTSLAAKVDTIVAALNTIIGGTGAPADVRASLEQTLSQAIQGPKTPERIANVMSILRHAAKASRATVANAMTNWDAAVAANNASIAAIKAEIGTDENLRGQKWSEPIDNHARFGPTYHLTAHINLHDNKLSVGSTDASTSTYNASHRVYLGVTANATSTNDLVSFRSRFGIHMRGIINTDGDDLDIYNRPSDANPFRSLLGTHDRREEDHFFVLAMKSIAAKIFTVVGMYDLIDRPTEIPSMTPIRAIIGAADDGYPKIDENIVELYFRLTLLAQFYKKLFGYDGDINDPKDKYEEIRRKDKLMKITMIPDIDGVFSGLVTLIFRKMMNVDNYAYSDEDIKNIITEINLIYSKLQPKYPDNTIYNIIMDFVSEVNRRYGIVTRDERNDLERELSFRYEYSSAKLDAAGAPVDEFYDRYDEDIAVQNWAILPGEGEIEVVQPAPSERYVSKEESLESNRRPKTTKYNITLDHKKILYNFRCMVDKYFSNPENHPDSMTFKPALKAAQMKLKKETTDEGKFAVIASLLRGVDVYSKLDNMKYLMFHETVVVGMNTLSALHTVLAEFKAKVLSIDVEEIFKVMVGKLTTAGNVDVASLIAAVKEHMSKKYGVALTDEELELTFGKREDVEAVGGLNRNNAAGRNEYVLRAIDGVNPAVLVEKDDGGIAVPAPAAAYANGKGGVLGVLDNTMTPTDVKEAKTAAAKKALATIKRFFFDRYYIMQTLLELVYGFSHDLNGTVNVRVDNGGQISMNFEPLKKMVEEMFANVAFFIDYFRPHIKRELLAPYTNKGVTGSFYWLHEQINEKIIIGRHVKFLDTAKTEYLNLEDLLKRINTTYKYLTQKWSVDGGNLNRNGAQSAVRDATATTAVTSYDKIFAKMIYYDCSIANSGIVKSSEADVAEGPKLMDFQGKQNQYEALVMSGVADKKVLDTRYIARYKQLYTWNEEFTYNRSLLFDFNQLVAKYIQQTYDTNTQKIYANAINGVVNGPLNNMIMNQEYTWPDTHPGVFITLKNNERVAENAETLAELRKQLVIDNDLFDLIKNDILAGAASETEIKARLMAAVLMSIKNVIRSMNAQAVASGNANAAEFGRFATSRPIRELFTAITQHRAISLANPIALTVNTFADIANFTGNGTDGKDGTTGAINTHQIGNSLNDMTAAIMYLTTDADYAVSAGTAMPRPLSSAQFDARWRVFTSAYRSLVSVISGNTDVDKIKSLLYPGLVDLANPVVDVAGQRTVITDLANRSPSAVNNAVAGIVAMKGYLDAAGIDGVDADTQSVIIAALAGSSAEKNKATIAKTLRSLKSVVSVDNLKYQVPAQDAQALMVTQDDIDGTVTPYIGNNYLRLATDDADTGLTSKSTWELFGIKRAGTDYKWGNSGSRVDMGHRLDADPEKILFTSLSVIIKNMFTSKNPQGLSQYIADNLVDVPNYMKEKYRATMPAFKSLFQTLINRANFIKMFVGRNEINLERIFTDQMFGSDANVGTAADGPTVSNPQNNPWPAKALLDVKLHKTDAKAKSLFIRLCDAIVKASQSFIGVCDQVMREMADDPKFLETYQGSIKDYKAMNKVDPLMPLSDLTYVLGNYAYDGVNDFFPSANVGTPQFKMQYGTRMILAQPTSQVTAESMPGWTNLVSEMNLTMSGREQLSVDRANQFAKSVVKIARFFNELRNFKGMLTSYNTTWGTAYAGATGVDDKLNYAYGGAFYRTNLVHSDSILMAKLAALGGAPATVTVATSNKLRKSIFAGDKWDNTTSMTKSAYQISYPLDEILLLTEDSNKENQITKLAKHMTNDDPDKNPDMDVQNIIDMNIVPINVHALMRELPLINLYNYAYTFDRMIIELYYGLDSKSSRKLITDLCGDNVADRIKNITSTRDMMIALLMDPYLNVFTMRGTDTPDNYFDGYIKRMLVGDNGLELGRPKFLSDQVFGKLIFGQLYETKDFYDEAGPHVAKPSLSSAANILTGVAITVLKLASATANSAHTGLLTNGDEYKFIELCRVVAGVAIEHDYTFAKLHDMCKHYIGSADYSGIIAIGHANRVAAVDGFAYLLALTVFINRQYCIKMAKQFASAADKALMLKTLSAINAMVFSIRSNSGPSAGARTLLTNFDGANAQIQNAAGNAIVLKWGTGVAAALDKVTGGIPNIEKADIRYVLNKLMRIGLQTPAHSSGGAGPMIATGEFNFAPIAHSNVSVSKITNTITGSLTYLDKNPDGDDESRVVNKDQVKVVTLDTEINAILHTLGRLRFDTVLVRNLVFLVNLYRSLRLKLNKELMYNKDVIAKSMAVTKSSLTEFTNNEVSKARPTYDIYGLGGGFARRFM